MRNQSSLMMALVAVVVGSVAGFAQNAAPGSAPAATGGATSSAPMPGFGRMARRPVPGTLPASERLKEPSSDPRVVGRLLGLNLLSRVPPQTWASPAVPLNAAWYGEVCTSFGTLRVAQELKNKELAEGVVKRYAPILTPAGKSILPPYGHVDRNVFGIVPLEIFRYNGDKEFLQVGKGYADNQWERPTAEGLSDQTRFWIDDMYMITSLQVQAYRATKEKVYLDRAATEMVAYLDKLQKPNGLFHHGENAPFFWGRGNGWVAVGLAELLSELPADHPQHARVLEGYHKMMAGLLKHQSKSGMWRQLLDKEEAWAESSCTGMFTFAFARGVKFGWLEAATYKEPTERAWKALTTYIDENANVREVCAGTNKGQTEEFYLERPRFVGDYHGQAGAIWAAWAMEQGLER